jgi:hypothetical protein
MEGPIVTILKKKVLEWGKGPQKRELLLYGNQSGTKYLEDKEVVETT